MISAFFGPTAEQSFLRLPPFPGAANVRLARRSPTTADCTAALEVLAVAKTGGTYWGARPQPPKERHAVVLSSSSEGIRRLVEAHTSTAEAPIPLWELIVPEAPTEVLDPWHVLESCDFCLIDNDLCDFALVAAALRKNVFGPFTQDPKWQRELIDRMIGQWQFLSPFDGSEINFREAIDIAGYWKRLIDTNRCVAESHGIGFWKKDVVEALLWPGIAAIDRQDKSSFAAVWRSRTDARTLERLDPRRIAEVEDGFIRSVGLGADCVPPLSIVVDFSGIYFDPSKPSDLETMLQEQEFDPAILARASALKALLVDRGISKYGTGAAAASATRPDGYLLVVGQVEDDRSIQLGTSKIRTNLDLLRRVRADHPDAIIVYRPHPDVEAGHRCGRIDRQEALKWADEVAAAEPITDLIAGASQVHVMTSLAGFEALLRGKQVITYGAPFYAGWGLTADLGEIPSRRTKTRNIDELVAAALLLYPRYLDPVTRLPCPPELLVDRLTTAAPVRPSLLTRLRRWQGRLRRWLT